MRLTLLACHAPDFVGLFVQLLTHTTLTRAAIVPAALVELEERERESLSVCLKLCLYQCLLPSRPLMPSWVSLIPAFYFFVQSSQTVHWL